jgi:Phycobilisome Linker polypeptide/CpcD/allophycocyanin linker domain
MYGQNTSDGSVSGSRFFKVTVFSGGKMPGSARIRRSTYTRDIPYDRLSGEMQRMAKSGDKVVSIVPTFIDGYDGIIPGGQAARPMSAFTPLPAAASVLAAYENQYISYPTSTYTPPSTTSAAAYQYQSPPSQPTRPNKQLETTKIELRTPFSEEELQVVLRAIYRQILGNINVVESERPIALESKLRHGELTVRGFIRELVKSEAYISRFFSKSSQQRFVKLNFKQLLGRAPHNQKEIARHVALYSAQGYEAEMDSYLNSEEYLSAFGDDMVPYYRDFEMQTNQSDYAGSVKH